MSPIEMPVAAAKAAMTADEFWDFCLLPENEHRNLELIRGEVVEVRRSTRRHGIVSANIAYYLATYVEGIRHGYVVGNGSGLILNTYTVVGTNVAYYTDAHRFEDIADTWAVVPPILVAEVQPHDDATYSMDMRIRDYLDNGVKLVWVADYLGRAITVHRPDCNSELFMETDVLSCVTELPGFQCKVANFFSLYGDDAPTVPPDSPKV